MTEPASPSTRSRSVRDRVAIVTGAGSGMGRATARVFASEGALVAACDRDGEAVEAVVDQIVAGGGRAQAWSVDVADVAAVDEFVAAAQSSLGPIDILVNNAGIAVPTSIDADDFAAAWERVLAVDLTAHVHLIRACLDDLARHGEGRIVNISSTEGLGGMAHNLPYTVAKHGVIGLTRSLAVELGPRGVTVNAVCPGPIHTGMTELIPDEHKATFARRRTALRRYGDPEEVAHMTLSLCLPAASYVTGAAIPVDGGLLARNQ